MKKWLAAALCTAAAMSASSALAANINFVTAGTSSTFYPISATVWPAVERQHRGHARDRHALRRRH